MPYLGYDFYFAIGKEVITLPITPESMKIKIGSNNKVITLIDEGEVNVLKSPSLAEIEFDARFPMRKYPYSREPLEFATYLNKFTDLKTNKQTFTFSVVRRTPGGKGTWGTSRVVSLESLTVKEDVKEGDDVILSFKLKECREFSPIAIKVEDSVPTSTSTSETPRNNNTSGSLPTDYVVKKGDCLWKIAKKFYGKGTNWTLIYNANKTVIENTANKYRKGKGSSNGKWIYPNTKLTIPAK